ncbi:MAG: histidine kinase [Rhizobiaceae bacterium]
MAKDPFKNPDGKIPSAADLRMALLEEEMKEMSAKQKARDEEKEKQAEFAADFLRNHVTDEERKTIRRLVQSAVENGQLEALVYSFPSDLCTDSGRAITNGEPNWPDTLKGKARELYDRYVQFGRPGGYRLKAKIISYPGGIPGDVGFYLNWEPEAI